MIAVDARHECATETLVQGSCEPDFDRVREAFSANLQIGDDLGASVCVYRYGRCVVDLSGGWTRAGRPYPQNSLHVLYSVTKGVVSICLMALAESGKLDLDRPVSSYWPEFAENGKERITVRQMLSHQAGLSGFAQTVAIESFSDWDRTVVSLASQKPFWPPGAMHGYHALTFGFLAGELIRRVSGRSASAFLRETFAEPMDVDVHIGLPASHAQRVVPLFDAPSSQDLGLALANAANDPTSLTCNAFNNPPIDTDVFNRPDVWAMEIPGANGIGSARGLAALYSVAVDGPLRGISSATVDDFRRECVFGPDLVLREQPTRFGAGFMLPCPREPMLTLNSFGHNGRGGSLAFADPESGVAFAYLGNRCIHDPTPHSRLWRLLSAVRASL